MCTDDSILDRLKNDESDIVRAGVVSHCRPRDKQQFLKDDSYSVREAMSKTNDDDYLDKVVDDKEWMVRMNVPKCGKDKYLDKLINDENRIVRSEVAEYGHDKHLDILRRDKDETVRYQVAKRGRDVDLDILKKDRVSQVRAAVADFGRPQDKERFLTNERVPFVRESYVEHCDFNDVRDFLNDPSEQVREAALKRLNAEH